LSRKKQKSTGISREEKVALVFIGVFHLVGAGLLVFAKGGLYQIALDLVPINLVFTSLVVFKFQEKYPPSFFLYLVLAFGFGVVVEMVGVNFGWLFGSYKYGEVLGYSLWNTPLVIGLNWVLLSYGVGCLCVFLPVPVWLKWVCSVVLLLVFDYFMEPVAMKNDFWSWANGSIPVQNYVGWALVSGLLMGYFFATDFPKKNRVAAFVWVIQLLFFMVQNLF
jgi:uncharacterized membrane protein